MSLNPFFLQGSPNEQFLVQDLINEQLKIYGIEVNYLPRKIFKTDNIIREIQSSKFDDSFALEAYLNNYDGYAPDSDIMTKFGLRLKNEISLTISRERYEEYIVPFLEGISHGIEEGLIGEFNFADLIKRPKEGDLIYFPLGKRLFEIKRVESEKPFYQLGSSYVYELSCELFEYENELIDTSIEEIDTTVEDEGYITYMTLVGSGVTAVATAGISTNSIREISLNNDGSGYTSTPTVTFSAPNSGINTATAVAITTSRANVQSILRLELTNGGSGYTTAPTITITGGGGTGAAATCSVGGTQFSVSSISISNPGTQYPIAPTITIGSPGVGVTATAVAGITTDNKLDYIRILNPGIGYTQAPTVSIIGGSTSTLNIAANNSDAYGAAAGLTALNGVSIQPNGTGSGETGGFNIGQSYLGFVGTATSRHAILTPIDSSDFDTMSINAIVGNDSNGGEDPDATNEELRLHYLESGGSSFKSISINPAGDQILSASADVIIALGAGNGALQDFSINIPSHAKGSGFTYMLYQGANSNSEHDHYGITNIKYQSSTIGIGTYIFNEVITGESSGTTAVVKDFTNTSSLTSLSLSINTGKFSNGEVIVGSSSSARYTVLDYDTDSYENTYDSNEDIEFEADNIIDFSESNPFGSY